MKVLFVVTTLIASISDIVGNSNYKGYTYLKTLLSQHLEDIHKQQCTLKNDIHRIIKVAFFTKLYNALLFKADYPYLCKGL
jgi:hypothetical protein